MLFAGGAGWDGELMGAPPGVPPLAEPAPGWPLCRWDGGGVEKTNSSRSLITCGATVVERQLLALCSSGTWGWAEPLAPSPAMGGLSAALGISVCLLFLASLLPHT